MLETSSDLRLLADLHATELSREQIQGLQAMNFLATAEFPRIRPISCWTNWLVILLTFTSMANSTARHRNRSGWMMMN